MPTNVSQIGQYVRGLVKGRPAGIFSVTDFGAVGDGQTSDKVAIQNAINAAEAEFDSHTAVVTNRISQAPAVFFPEGTYLVDGTLLISRKLRLYGQGYMNSIIRGTGNAPILRVDNTVQRLYSSTIFEHLAICGDDGDGVASKTNQHGIELLDTANLQDTTIDVRWCAIEYCGGHGLYCPDNVNTPRIFGNIIQNNWYDGIRFSGIFATNARILHNVIRENRVGVVYDGTAAAGESTPFLYSGDIAFNLFEENWNGTGQVGANARPARGISLSNTRLVSISNNYFEKHLHHVYLDAAASLASAYVKVHNNFFNGISIVPWKFKDIGAPAARPCDIALAHAGLTGITCTKNKHEVPSRPTSGPFTTTPAQWSGGAWGDVLPVFAIMDGEKHVIEEDVITESTFDTANSPLFKRLAQNALEAIGVAKDETGGLMLTGLDGNFSAGEFFEIKGQRRPYDIAGKSAIRFNRRPDGGGYLSFHHNSAADALQSPVTIGETDNKLKAAAFGTANATASVPNNTATTVYTFPNGDAAYLCWVYVDGGGNALNGFAIVVTDGANARVAIAGNGTSLTLGVSGLALRATQTSGAPQTIKVALMKMT